MYLLLYFCRIGTNKMLYFALNLFTISFGTAIFDQINMLKSMFTLYFYYLNYTINASPPFNATPPFKVLENRL